MILSFEEYTKAYLSSFHDSSIKDAMFYAMEGGKHFRANLIFAIVKGHDIDVEKAYPAALALEMVHSYSLIHDDLPCMDDDDFRRGKPSLHKAFQEDVAVLTGDALLTHAFGVIADSFYEDDVKIKMISLLSKLAGMDGMIYGQLLDISHSSQEEIKEEELNEIQDYKTGALFKVAFLMGMLIADDCKNQHFYEEMALRIGRIFQIQDDLFDVIKTSEETGKSQSDEKNQKATALSLYDVDMIQARLKDAFTECYRALENVEFNSSFLEDILKKMEER